MKRESIVGSRDLLYGGVFLLTGLVGFAISPKEGVWELIVALSFAVILGILSVLLLRSYLVCRYAKSQGMKKFILGKGLFNKIGYGLLALFVVALIIRTVMEGSIDPSLFYIAIPFCSVFTYVSVMYVGEEEVIVNGKVIIMKDIKNIMVQKALLNLYAIRIHSYEQKVPVEIHFDKWNALKLIECFDKDTTIKIDNIENDLLE